MRIERKRAATRLMQCFSSVRSPPRVHTCGLCSPARQSWFYCLRISLDVSGSGARVEWRRTRSADSVASLSGMDAGSRSAWWQAKSWTQASTRPSTYSAATWVGMSFPNLQRGNATFGAEWPHEHRHFEEAQTHLRQRSGAHPREHKRAVLLAQGAPSMHGLSWLGAQPAAIRRW